MNEVSLTTERDLSCKVPCFPLAYKKLKSYSKFINKGSSKYPNSSQTFFEILKILL